MIKHFSGGLLIFCVTVMAWMVPVSFSEGAAGQEASGVPVYDVTAEVDVLEDNFVVARRKAVTAAMREVVKAVLEEMLGTEVYEANLRLLRNTIARARRYVRGYRFIEAIDNSNEMIVEVHLEITLFTEVLRKKMRRLGILTGPGAEGTVVILIKEQSLALPGDAGFWDQTPFAESSLSQGLTGAGFMVVNRDSLQGLISEETALQAMNGDIETAADIGLKTGADIVIVGHAVSTKMPGQSALEMQTVQANMSLKVLSPLNSVIIAAKSDFAAAEGVDVMDGEKEAFQRVSKKFSGFLVDSIRKYHEEKPAVQTPAPEIFQPPALPLTDL
ncbi:MAG: hypothetical protein VYC17_04680 [Nitrospinota bacterium]|nr:hypothetical protein [Nitrospinota bacterium]